MDNSISPIDESGNLLGMKEIMCTRCFWYLTECPAGAEVETDCPICPETLWGYVFVTP